MVKSVHAAGMITILQKHGQINTSWLAPNMQRPDSLYSLIRHNRLLQMEYQLQLSAIADLRDHLGVRIASE
jgi:hypothetical protein